MPPSPADPLKSPAPQSTVRDRRTRLIPPEFALLRFVAGMRAMLVLLAGIGALVYPRSHSASVDLVLLPYIVWSAVLLWKTLGGWSRASWPLWLWVDAAVVFVTCQLLAQEAPLLGIVLVLPVVAMALLAGVAHAMVLALAGASALLFVAMEGGRAGALPPPPWLVPVVLVAFGPAAALLARPSRELQQRLKFLDAFNDRLDPRQGLGHHVAVLIDLLADQLKLSGATISLQGLEPRIFQWRLGGAVQVLSAPELPLWRERLAQLPHHMGSICSSGGGASVVALHPQAHTVGSVSEPARHAMLAIGPQALALPLVTYGRPHGYLCLARSEPAFNAGDLRWLDDVMREALPLLERSDLLEQLQRETAAHERERIGRDLHDSAVQPYLGLKYGLEALARQAGAHNPISPKIAELVRMTTEELQTLRDVVSGLRSGHDPASGRNASLNALQRQVARFEALYGLKVNVFAPASLQLRGAAAKAVLHMVNEALTNVRRHTSATAATILLDAQESNILLRLRNDHGPGEPLPADFVPLSLTERAAELGGGVIVTHETNFTEIAITLPLIGVIG